jgi:hypothetical protein
MEKDPNLPLAGCESAEFWYAVKRQADADAAAVEPVPVGTRIDGQFGSWRTTGPLQIAPDGLGLAWALPAEMCEGPQGESE